MLPVQNRKRRLSSLFKFIVVLSVLVRVWSQLFTSWSFQPIRAFTYHSPIPIYIPDCISITHCPRVRFVPFSPFTDLQVPGAELLVLDRAAFQRIMGDSPAVTALLEEHVQQQQRRAVLRSVPLLNEYTG